MDLQKWLAWLNRYYLEPGVDLHQLQRRDVDLTASRTTEKVVEGEVYSLELLNDDYTPMDFVAELLMDEFSLTEMDAWQLVVEVHNFGNAELIPATDDGIFVEQMANRINDRARRSGHPLSALVRRW